MKGLFIVAALFTCLGLSSCQSKEPSGTMVVEIPWYKEGRYQISKVELNGVSSLDPFFGKHAAFTVGPRISETEMVGESATVKYMKKSGVIHPLDDISAEVLTVYAHFQKLHELDRASGVGERLRWPRRIGLRVLTTVGDSGLIEDNALYFEPIDATFIVPYTKGEVPLSINPGIVAHEHFHAIFSKIAMAEFDKTQRVSLALRVHEAEATEAEVQEYADNVHLFYNDTLMRGMNEGFADFWGWLYSGDPEFITRSLPGALGRSLKTKGAIQRFDSIAQMHNRLKGYAGNEKQGVIDIAYRELTNKYSKFLIGLAEIIGQKQGALEVAKILIEHLPELGSELSEKYQTTSISALQPLVKLVENFPEEHKEAACQLYHEFSPVFTVINSKTKKEEIYTDAPQVAGCQAPPQP